jgi:hypothetical protein
MLLAKYTQQAIQIKELQILRVELALLFTISRLLALYSLLILRRSKIQVETGTEMMAAATVTQPRME